MKNIALITTSYPDRNLGSEAAGSFVEDFAEELSRDCNVTVFAPSLSHRTEKLNPNLTIQRFKVPRLPLSLLSAANPLHWPAIIKTLHSGQRVINCLADQTTPDHVLALWALPSGYWARSIQKRHGIPYSVWALGSDIWTLGKLPLIRNVLGIVLRDAFECFADGYQLREDVKTISSRSCEFLPSSRKLPQCDKKLKDKPPYNLAFLGRWHLNKGIDLLCDALGLLDDKDWDRISGVRICGGGPMERVVKTAAQALQAKGRPVFVQGYLDRNQAFELLLWADYVLIPSRIESIPVIFSDAVKCRCPVICMPVGDLPRLVKEYAVGRVAESTNSISYAVSLKKALNYAPNNFRLGLETASKNFDVISAVNKYLAYLEHLNFIYNEERP